MTKQQTAVDIAIKKCYQAIIDSKDPNAVTKRSADYRIGLIVAIDILDNLKEMEKEQIITSRENGFLWGMRSTNNFYSDKIIESEQYYNETYGGNK